VSVVGPHYKTDSWTEQYIEYLLAFMTKVCSTFYVYTPKTFISKTFPGKRPDSFYVNYIILNLNSMDE